MPQTFDLFRASRITGHIMKIDGGKSLTSRGQQNWYGFKFMTRKFEQEAISSWNYSLSSDSVKPKPALGDSDYANAMSTWCDQVRLGSKWSTADMEAHLKQNSQYNRQEEQI